MKIKKRFKVVIDTNVLLVSISEYSKYHWIYRLIIDQKIDVCITTEILCEYVEVISEKFNVETANSVLRTLLELENVKQVTIYYLFHLIERDADDNKFADCAIAGNAEYLVTNDNDFNILKQIEFPKVNVINIQEFKDILMI